MTEQTNLTKTQELVFEPEGLVDEDTGEPVVESKDNPTSATTTAPSKVKIKYNGVEEEITLEDAIVLAQKGKNYDKLSGKLESIENGEDRKMLSAMAKEAGFKDIPSYVKSLDESHRKTKLDEKMNAYIDEGLAPDYAKRLAEADLAQAPKQDDSNELAFQELFNEYPETQKWSTLNDFPEEVRTAIEQGKTPVVAYSKYFARQAEETANKAKLNEENTKLDTGSLGSQGSAVEDPFLRGFLGK